MDGSSMRLFDMIRMAAPDKDTRAEDNSFSVEDVIFDDSQEEDDDFYDGLNED